jgi:hypothetical protein
MDALQLSAHIATKQPRKIRKTADGKVVISGSGAGAMDGEEGDRNEYDDVEFDATTVSWSSLLGPEGCAVPRQSSLCFAVVHECLRGMSDSELVVRAAALAALKRLCVEAGNWGGLGFQGDVADQSSPSTTSAHSPQGISSSFNLDIVWMDIITSLVVPAVRRGLKQSTDVIKKNFVSLLAHIVSTLGTPARHLADTLGMAIAEAQARNQAKAEAITTEAVATASDKKKLLSGKQKKGSHKSKAIEVDVNIDAESEVEVEVDIQALSELKISWERMADTCHADLAFLQHEDAEQNFFENITHMQLHRRVRALAKLRGVLIALADRIDKEEKEKEKEVATALAASAASAASVRDAGAAMAVVADSTVGANLEQSSTTAATASAAEGSIGTLTIGLSSLAHVLLPLALHPLTSEEFKKKDHQTLLQEAAQFIGAVGRHLPWTQYFAGIKTLLKQLDRQKSDKEKVQ